MGPLLAIEVHIELLLIQKHSNSMKEIEQYSIQVLTEFRVIVKDFFKNSKLPRGYLKLVAELVKENSQFSLKMATLSEEQLITIIKELYCCIATGKKLQLTEYLGEDSSFLVSLVETLDYVKLDSIPEFLKEFAKLLKRKVYCQLLGTNMCSKGEKGEYLFPKYGK